MESMTSGGVRPGRPRSERARRAVLDAARDLLTDHGLPALTIDQIAGRAGVSKATIYRWWPTKAAVVMEAFFEATAPKLEFPDSGSPIERLATQAARVAHLMTEPQARRPFVALIAASQHDTELASALRERFLEVRRAQALDTVRQAIAEGQLRPADPELIIDMIYGALYYRLLISGAPLTEQLAHDLVTAVATRHAR